MSPPLRLIDRLHRLVFFAVSLLRRVGARPYGRIADWQHRRADHWSYASDAYERARFAAALGAPGEGPFAQCLEVACSEGIFSEMLARDPRIGHLLACDVSPRALERAAERLAAYPHVACRLVDLVDTASLDGPYDLIYCMDVLYYLGINVGFVARRLSSALAPGGRMVVVHLHPEADQLFEPFKRAPDMQVVSTTIVPDAVRPCQVLVLEKLRRPTD